ncbi:MAG TPA: transglutaminase-like domain-containing protein [Nitrospiria bacterium]|jgi:regulator of sirC expression with transglutaminase-like and TPR domain|nr:transglutaminase-like domain-containing protein [Nitrospiria bacterium]
MKQITDNQLRALFKLLSDDDEKIAKLVSQQILQVGEPAIPLLEQTAAEDSLIGDRARAVLAVLQFKELEEAFLDFSAKDDAGLDLEEGAFLIARFGYPQMKPTNYQALLDDMATEIAPNIRRKRLPEEILRTINNYLFLEQGFVGNTDHYYDPDNSYINRVLDRRTGIPISLSIVYLLIAKRLELPVFGIGMPGHFLVKYSDKKNEILADPFNKGRLLTKTDCANFLINSGYDFEESYLAATPNRTILSRMIRNLISVYTKQKEIRLAEHLGKLLAILEKPQG